MIFPRYSDFEYKMKRTFIWALRIEAAIIFLLILLSPFTGGQTLFNWAIIGGLLGAYFLYLIYRLILHFYRNNIWRGSIIGLAIVLGYAVPFWAICSTIISPAVGAGTVYNLLAVMGIVLAIAIYFLGLLCELAYAALRKYVFKP